MNTATLFTAIIAALALSAKAAPIQRRSGHVYDMGDYDYTSLAGTIFPTELSSATHPMTSTALAATPTHVQDTHASEKDSVNTVSVITLDPFSPIPTSTMPSKPLHLQNVRIGLTRPSTQLLLPTPGAPETSTSSMAQESLLLDIAKNLMVARTEHPEPSTPTFPPPTPSDESKAALLSMINSLFGTPTGAILVPTAPADADANTISVVSAPTITAAPSSPSMAAARMANPGPSPITTASEPLVSDFDSLIAAMQADMVPPLFRSTTTTASIGETGVVVPTESVVEMGAAARVTSIPQSSGDVPTASVINADVTMLPLSATATGAGVPSASESVLYVTVITLASTTTVMAAPSETSLPIMHTTVTDVTRTTTTTLASETMTLAVHRTATVDVTTAITAPTPTATSVVVPTAIVRQIPSA